MDLMVRWEPGAQERLQAAALDLYARRGFEQTTAADIAEAVGLTERTFFRYFADKREVLFAGQEQFRRVFLDGVAAAPKNASALSDSIAEGLRRRGVTEPRATLAAETGVTVFGVAFRQWVAEDEQRSLAAVEAAVLDDLRALSLSVR